MVNNTAQVIDDEQFQQFVPNCHFELIRICDLVSNQEYQRNLSILLVKSAVEEYDLHQINPVKVSRRDGINYVYDGQHTVEIVGTVEKIYDKYGFETLNRVFQLIVATWEGDQNSLSSSMLNGVARIVDAYQDKLRDNVFAQKLGMVSPKEIIRNARERRSGSLGFAEVMVQYYNKKCKYGLPYEALRSSRSRPLESIPDEEIRSDEETDGNPAADSMT